MGCRRIKRESRRPHLRRARLAELRENNLPSKDEFLEYAVHGCYKRKESEQGKPDTHYVSLEYLYGQRLLEDGAIEEALKQYEDDLAAARAARDERALGADDVARLAVNAEVPGGSVELNFQRDNYGKEASRGILKADFDGLNEVGPRARPVTCTHATLPRSS